MMWYGGSMVWCGMVVIWCGMVDISLQADTFLAVIRRLCEY